MGGDRLCATGGYQFSRHFHVPGALSLNFSRILQEAFSQVHFTGRKTDAQGGERTHPKPRCWYVMKRRL